MKTGCDAWLADAVAQILPKAHATTAQRRIFTGSCAFQFPASEFQMCSRNRHWRSGSVDSRDAFELDRGLGFVVDHAAAQHHGSNGVEETAEA